MTEAAKPRWNNAVASREEQRAQKRHAVLMAGAKLFCEKGYEGTSLDDIAAELSITKRTIYYYVQSKEEILFGCNKLGLEYIDEIADLCSDAALTPLERINKMVLSYADWVSTDLGACLIMISDRSLSTDHKKQLRATKLRLDLLMQSILREGIEEGSIRPGDPRIMTSAIFGALNWLPRWNRGAKPISYEMIAQDYIDLFVQGLKPRG